MRVFVLVLAVVFAVESGIMFLLPSLPAWMGEGWTLALVDALLLVTFLYPALWILAVRPLRSLLATRGTLLARTYSVQEEERARLARDLHDELGQTQTAILLALRSIAQAKSLEQARDRAEAAHEMAVAAVDSTRRLARGLSPSVLLDFGLGQAVERMCEDLASTTGLSILRQVNVGGRRFDREVEITTYRVLQEALTNAAKHAGASSITVELAHDAEQLSMMVTDNGRGLTTDPSQRAKPSGLGLASMRDRVTLLGGRLDLRGGPSGGTVVSATLPAIAISSGPESELDSGPSNP